MGAARASTPSAINRAPATRFPKTPEGCGMSHSLAVKAIQEDEVTITVYQLSQSRKANIYVALWNILECGTLHCTR
jgi:hypothetical protein